jgi:hypothetical protein
MKIKIVHLSIYFMHSFIQWVAINIQGTKKSNKNRWAKPSYRRQKGRPKKGQKTCNLREPKKGKR